MFSIRNGDEKNIPVYDRDLAKLELSLEPMRDVSCFIHSDWL